MLFVFVANLARPALLEADAIAPLLGKTPYETRLALAAGPPSIVLTTSDRDRAANVLGLLRGRGHGAHTFDDDEAFVKSEAMPRLDDFRLDTDGVRRVANEDLLPYGDVYAILRAVHESSSSIERNVSSADRIVSESVQQTVTVKLQQREHVAYFFRRSGERPWLLRERHTSFVGLGQERGPVAFANFTRLLARIREAAPMAVFDDRLVRRRVVERLDTEGLTSSRHGMDLLAHLLAMTIASQGGSPYR